MARYVIKEVYDGKGYIRHAETAIEAVRRLADQYGWGRAAFPSWTPKPAGWSGAAAGSAGAAVRTGITTAAMFPNPTRTLIGFSARDIFTSSALPVG